MKKNMEYWDNRSTIPDELGINKVYLGAFKAAKFPGDDKQTLLKFNNYKSAFIRFCTAINKNVLHVTYQEMIDYLDNFENISTRESQRAFIKSVLVFVVQNNINNSHNLVTRNALIMLLSI